MPMRIPAYRYVREVSTAACPRDPEMTELTVVAGIAQLADSSNFPDTVVAPDPESEGVAAAAADLAAVVVVVALHCEPAGELAAAGHLDKVDHAIHNHWEGTVLERLRGPSYLTPARRR